jgi:hypothetical protein
VSFLLSSISPISEWPIKLIMPVFCVEAAAT